MVPNALRLSDEGARYTVSKLGDRATTLQKVTQPSFECKQVKNAEYQPRTVIAGSQIALCCNEYNSVYTGPNAEIPKAYVS